MEPCNRNAVIGHAVVLVGYSQDNWLLQNSWGNQWGEDGFMRLHRHADHIEEGYCGMDDKPQAGSGCKDGPPRVSICGTCGILYDVTVPVMELRPEGLWSKNA